MFQKLRVVKDRLIADMVAGGLVDVPDDEKVRQRRHPAERAQRPPQSAQQGSEPAAGGAVVEGRAALDGAALVAAVQRPSAEMVELLPPGSTLVGLLAPHQARVTLNGAVVGTVSFNGQESGKASFTIPR